MSQAFNQLTKFSLQGLLALLTFGAAACSVADDPDMENSAGTSPGSAGSAVGGAAGSGGSLTGSGGVVTTAGSVGQAGGTR